MVFLIKLMTIPHLIKNYGLGITDITFLQFIVPSSTISFCYGCFWIYFARQMNSLTDTQKDNKLFWFKYGLLIVSISIFIYIAYYAKKTYEEIEEEIRNEKNNVKNKEKLIGNDQDKEILTNQELFKE